jgi:GntR family transcriptional regulator
LNAIETSKTHRLYLFIKERITSGVLQPGHRLPSEPRLAESHRLSRVTVRRALDGLAQDGLIVRKPGAGTFVRAAMPGPAPGPAIVADLSNMLAQLAAMGRATRVKLLTFDYCTPPPAVAQALKLKADERAQHAVRIRSLDRTPFSILTTYVPEAIGVTYTEKDLRSTPLLELIERSGVVASTASQTISATLAGPDAASALGVEIGSALLSLKRVVLDGNGRGIEHLTALYRPDIHAFRMEMTRTDDGSHRLWRPMTETKITQTGRRAVKTRRRRP